MSAKKLFLANGEFALVDEEDLPRVRMHRWQIFRAGPTKKGYVRRQYRSQGKQITENLAHLIMDAKPGDMVKYRDGNPLNCQRANLYFPPRLRKQMLKATKLAAEAEALEHDPLDETWSS